MHTTAVHTGVRSKNCLRLVGIRVYGATGVVGRAGSAQRLRRNVDDAHVATPVGKARAAQSPGQTEPSRPALPGFPKMTAAALFPPRPVGMAEQQAVRSGAAGSNASSWGRGSHRPCRPSAIMSSDGSFDATILVVVTPVRHGWGNGP